ncbi:hypothetical protein EDB19DRAFT_1372522 [Suillus lakei]|nr:hypothetical protein EDB19DRAFT_1372522 [Suillus lakei]
MVFCGKNHANAPVFEKIGQSDNPHSFLEDEDLQMLVSIAVAGAEMSRQLQDYIEGRRLSHLCLRREWYTTRADINANSAHSRIRSLDATGELELVLYYLFQLYYARLAKSVSSKSPLSFLPHTLHHLRPPDFLTALKPQGRRKQNQTVLWC